MKIRIIFIMLAVFLTTCSKSPTKSDVSFALSDLVGEWTGEASNSSNTINLNLTVDEDGNVTGSGVSSTWSITVKGKVTGGGSFSFIAGSSFMVSSGSWDLKLNDGKTRLTGEFDVSFSGLHDMDVTLTKS